MMSSISQKKLGAKKGSHLIFLIFLQIYILFVCLFVCFMFYFTYIECLQQGSRHLEQVDTQKLAAAWIKILNST